MFPQTDAFWIFDLRSKITFVPRQKSSKTQKKNSLLGPYFLPRAVSQGDLNHYHPSYSQVTHYSPFFRPIPSSDSQSITIHLIIPNQKSLNCLQKLIALDSTPKVMLLLFSQYFVSDSLQPHELQHTRL